MSRAFQVRLITVLAIFLFLITSTLAAAASSSEAMVAAGRRFLDSLTQQERQQALLPIDSDEFAKFNVVPDSTTPCTGLPLKAMTAAQRTLAQELLKAGLSEKGYSTVTGIMDLQRVLQSLDKKRNAAHDPLAYCVTLFGTPSPDSDWAWRMEGPHLSLHFTVVKGHLASNVPTFAGSNPAEVRTGKQKGLRPLGEQDDAARAMLMALPPAEQAKAIISTDAPEEIVTGTRARIEPMKPAGLQSKEMTPEQRLQLIGVVKTYASLMPDDLARERVDRIYSAGVDQLYFAWAGSAQPGEKHYYRIQGPTFVIEFVNAQDDANHVHTVWRDFNDDFGRDLLGDRTKAKTQTQSGGSDKTGATAGP